MSPKSIFFMVVILMTISYITSSLAIVNFDISDVSYDIDNRLDESTKTLTGVEKITFKTGANSYKSIYFSIKQNYNPGFFYVDSVQVNGKSVTFSIPERELLRIDMKEPLPPWGPVEVKLGFTIKFGDNLDDYNAGYEGGNFYCHDCYPMLAEFDLPSSPFFRYDLSFA